MLVVVYSSTLILAFSHDPLGISAGSQQSAGGFGAAPGLSGGQEDQRVLSRQQVRHSTERQTDAPAGGFSITTNVQYSGITVKEPSRPGSGRFYRMF